tara:strand:- start:2010 stop:3371 length:1362 start_codon:yes stop_codon:yes gene_type:complete
MFIFLLQTVWLYISELAGKDLEIDIILEFLINVSPRLVILVLPLTILLSSIMVFGSISENYEFAAMKASGISLQRSMKSLIYFTFILGLVTFIFSNNIAPIAEYNFHNLRKNISKIKPAMAIAEGQFSQIGNYNIKVKEKYGSEDKKLKDVIIHQKKNKPGNYTVIKSKEGEIISEENSDILQLKLYSGNYYDEILSEDYTKNIKKPFIKSFFEEYLINIDIASLNDVDFSQEDDVNKHSMMSVNELNVAIDSLKIKRLEDIRVISSKMYNRSNFKSINYNLNPNDKINYENDNFLNLFQIKKQKQLYDLAISSIKSTISIVKSNNTIQSYRELNLNKHIITMHDKFSLGFACIILFFIGAPLGTIIRKGGYGLPLVISIILFLIYHFLGIFSKNLAEDSSINPILASWLSTLIMFPFSVYLTHRATNDKSIFNFGDKIYDTLNKIKKRNVKG